MGVSVSYAINGANPVTVGGAGTGIKYFPNVPAASAWLSGTAGVNAAVTSNQIGSTPSSTNNNGGLLVPGRSVLNAQQFSVLASGNILFGTGEVSTTGKVGMYLSNVASGVAPAYQTLIELTLTNQALDNTYYPWSLRVDFEGDTQSGILSLVKSGQINGTVTTPTQVTALTGISFATEPAFTLVVGVTFGTSDAGNSANMYQFQLSSAS